ncbi:axial regulator YABBY 1-like [Hibiscus syriacus]|uniref:Axial regulator YABBY 1-like n=1 Tax=Hibiscus syriacus TaxID=106335 RepID=A0A6A3AFE1_HIBSY|nr:protein GRAVITROPIC IN THE LIGHT 1-like [Hibiscus syriacus]KAE8702758.1 axial regulator YABBY 1-like [Hibiscus syriacus]
MDGNQSSITPKPPQISEMFQKFALVFKTKTFDFFADNHDKTRLSESDGFSLLDSMEDFIADQKVVVIKPDPPPNSSSSSSIGNSFQSITIDTRIANSLVSSVFDAVSSFEASYLQLQISHVPFEEEGVKSADRALVSHLQRLSDLKRFYREIRKNPHFEAGLSLGSCLEAQVQENQSKLRALETVSNRLQEEIDEKDNQVSSLRKKLAEIQWANTKLLRKLSGNLSSACDVLLTVRVFESVLHEACRATHKFSKILIGLMGKAGWELDLVANSVYPDIDYAKKGHTRFAFLFYICLGMFRGFDIEGFGLSENERLCNGDNATFPLKQLLEHVSSNPMELLSRDQSCEYSRFCEKKYQELIHPTMESSIFSNLDKNEAVLNSWRSLSIFYESFVSMASSIWTLHKLAFSFDPVVEIFRVERRVDFSMVCMEDVTKRYNSPGQPRVKVGFTVIPGFKIGRTVVQSLVYLNGLKCTV